MAFCIQASEITHHFYHVLWVEASPSMPWFKQVKHKPHFSMGEGSRNLQIWFKSANCDTSAQYTLPGYLCIYKVTCCTSQLLILVQEGSVLSLPILWGTVDERLQYLPPHFPCHFFINSSRVWYLLRLPQVSLLLYSLFFLPPFPSIPPSLTLFLCLSFPFLPSLHLSHFPSLFHQS